MPKTIVPQAKYVPGFPEYQEMLDAVEESLGHIQQWVIMAQMNQFPAERCIAEIRTEANKAILALYPDTVQEVG